MACDVCGDVKASVIYAATQQRVCKPCFFQLFEDGVHSTITATEMFRPGERVGLGVSGGKDSTVLAYVLDLLNRRHHYGLDIVLLCFDEGIAGYRDRSIATVHSNQATLGLPLRVVSFEELFGTGMDGVVAQIGRRNNCSFCGVFRRQALEEAARQMGATCIATGHNADDMAESVLLNFVRGDTARLRRCVYARTPVAEEALDRSVAGSLPDEGPCCSSSGQKMDSEASQRPVLLIPRCKPFKYTHQRDIVFYAFYKNLPYFSTECTYAPNAARGDARALIKELEQIDPSSIRNLILSAEAFQGAPVAGAVRACITCGRAASSATGQCSACRMLKILHKQ